MEDERKALFVEQLSFHSDWRVFFSEMSSILQKML